MLAPMFHFYQTLDRIARFLNRDDTQDSRRAAPVGSDWAQINRSKRGTPSTHRRA